MRKKATMSHESPTDFRFEVALSFAGDGKRDLVRETAKHLENVLGPKRVFFDEWFEAEIAGFDAHAVLQRIYQCESRMVVACVCRHYADKPWTQDEWRAIQSLERRLRDARSGNIDRLRLLPLRFGDGDVDGLFDTAIVPDVRKRSARQIANLILKRLNELDTRARAWHRADQGRGKERRRTGDLQQARCQPNDVAATDEAFLAKLLVDWRDIASRQGNEAFELSLEGGTVQRFDAFPIGGLQQPSKAVFVSSSAITFGPEGRTEVDEEQFAAWLTAVRRSEPHLRPLTESESQRLFHPPGPSGDLLQNPYEFEIPETARAYWHLNQHGLAAKQFDGTPIKTKFATVWLVYET